MLDEMVAKLREHFDAVEIMVSWQRDEGDGRTLGLKRGGGSWYARQGMAHEFIETDRAQEHAAALARQIRPEGE